DDNQDTDKVRIISRIFESHRVAAVAVCALGDTFITAGQDGRIFAFSPTLDSEVSYTSHELFSTEGEWIEALASHTKCGLIACAYANKVVVIDRKGHVISRVKLEHTVTSITFDSTGSRLGASHYNGVSLLQADGNGDPTSLYWKGSHVALSWSLDDRYIVTATQDREVHVWDLVTMQDFRMGGYPRKVRSFGWVAGKEMLVSSGADVVTAWSFAGAGPGRKPPLEIGFVFGATVTAVSSHPVRDYVACGFSTGNVQVGATCKGEALIAQASSGSPVTGVAWSCKGNFLAATNSAGYVSVFLVPQDLGIR
ncbi:MAG: WD40 repeat domain-containing protein, partial [Pseudomonadota bacterium]